VVALEEVIVGVDLSRLAAHRLGHRDARYRAHAPGRPPVRCGGLRFGTPRVYSVASGYHRPVSRDVPGETPPGRAIVAGIGGP